MRGSKRNHARKTQLRLLPRNSSTSQQRMQRWRMRFYRKIKTILYWETILNYVALIFYHSVKQKTIAFPFGTIKRNGEMFAFSPLSSSLLIDVQRCFKDVQRCARTPVFLAEVKTCSSRTASKYRCVMLTLSCPKRRLKL